MGGCALLVIACGRVGLLPGNPADPDAGAGGGAGVRAQPSEAGMPPSLSNGGAPPSSSQAGAPPVLSDGGAVGAADACALPLHFDALPWLPVGQRPLWLAAADFDADGKMDVVTTAVGSSRIGINFGQDNASFAGLMLYPTAAKDLGQGVVADLTGDGLVDIAVVVEGGVRILVNRGKRQFEDPITLTVAERPVALAAADLSGDQRLDLAVATYTETITVLLNQGGGTFSEPKAYPAGFGTRDVAAGDVNGDGAVDLVVANVLSTTVSLLLNQGAGTFGEPVLYEVGTAPISVALVDLDADGDRDIATANSDSATSPCC